MLPPHNGAKHFDRLINTLFTLCILLCISRIWNETWLASFFYKPCNYELFVKQSLNMEMAIVMARVWILISFIGLLLQYTSICLFKVTYFTKILMFVFTIFFYSGLWHGLDHPSGYWWTDTSSRNSGILNETVAIWCAWGCWHGCFSKLCEFRSFV